MFALIGGDVRHGGGAGDARPAVPGPPAEPARRAAARRLRPLPRGRRRAVGPRRAARRVRSAPAARGVPFVLWATIWAHPRTAAHALSYLPLRHLYRNADAIATYGPHVSAYVRSKGARGPVFEAPQSVDDAFWSAPARPIAACPFPGHVCRPIGAGKGCRGAPSGLAFLRLVSTISRAGSGRRRSDPSPGRRHRRGRARRPGRSRDAAQLLRGLRRCGHTVDPHARLPASRGGWSPTKPSTRESP